MSAALLIVVQGASAPCTTIAACYGAPLLAFLAGAAIGFLIAVELTPWAWRQVERDEQVPPE